MCYGFCGFYSRDGTVYFTAPDGNGNCSHRRTADKLPKGVDEKDLIPFECSKWTKESFRWDIPDVPDWITNEDRQAVIDVIELVKIHFCEFKKVKDRELVEYISYIIQDECDEIINDAQIKYCKNTYEAWEEMVDKIKLIDGYVE